MKLSSTAFILSTIVSASVSFVHQPLATTSRQYNSPSFITTSSKTSPSTTTTTATTTTSRNALAANTSLGKPGTAELDTPWEELGFEFRPTKSNLRITYKDGKWGEFELCEVRC